MRVLVTILLCVPGAALADPVTDARSALTALEAAEAALVVAEQNAMAAEADCRAKRDGAVRGTRAVAVARAACAAAQTASGDAEAARVSYLRALADYEAKAAVVIR